ncbi:MAG: hypothetical protein EZS28_007488 [Streblomastix strix]|uniref:Uncharacterized protein n=1 Tax=Streblomastix strix TaxID=222440 RepID=A0A5J4WSB4_9EUKA|nr:MAG: hypothetical protein EZS28_007488 [Streblomastix strix]
MSLMKNFHQDIRFDLVVARSHKPRQSIWFLVGQSLDGFYFNQPHYLRIVSVLDKLLKLFFDQMWVSDSTIFKTSLLVPVC